MKTNKSSVNYFNVKSASVTLIKLSCILNVLSKPFNMPVVISQIPFNIRSLKNFKLLLCALLIFGTFLTPIMKAQVPEPSLSSKQNDSSVSERKKHKNIFSIESETAFSFNLENLFSNCSQTLISVGETKEGNLTTTDCIVNNRYAKEYTFNGEMGQQIFISMHSSEASQIDPYLYLLKDGKVIASNDDSSEESLNSNISGADGYFTLPSTGIYTIRATTFEEIGAEFSYTGSYKISLNINIYSFPSLGIPINYENAEVDTNNYSAVAGCTYSLSVPSRPGTSTVMNWYWLSGGGSNWTINVNTQAGCQWATVNNASSWLTINSGGGNRVGPGSFVYSIAANSGAFRGPGSISRLTYSFLYTIIHFLWGYKIRHFNYFQMYLFWKLQ
jgi:hypothetical protein